MVRDAQILINTFTKSIFSNVRQYSTFSHKFDDDYYDKVDVERCGIC